MTTDALDAETTVYDGVLFFVLIGDALNMLNRSWTALIPLERAEKRA